MSISTGRFQGKAILVVGATSGIGRSAAIAFAAEGAHVVIAGRREDKGRQVAQEIVANGGTVTFVRVDTRDAASIAHLFKEVHRLHGRLDIAFNNAGMPGDNFKRTADHTESNWDTVIAINLKGVWLCMKSELTLMSAAGRGVIVNTASIYGMVGSDFGIAPYVASKHGVIGLTRAAAIEYSRDNIRINAVSPGFTRSEMIEPALQAAPEEFGRQVERHVPMGRLAEPEEIARAVLWLCSDESSFVTGTTLSVDGGWLAK